MIFAFRLTYDEFDFITEHSSNEELDILLTGSDIGFSSSNDNQKKVAYAEKKLMVQTLSSLLERHYLPQL